MSVISSLTPDEVARVYREAYSGVSFALALVNSPGNLTAQSPLEMWLAHELDMESYQRVRVTPASEGSLEEGTTRFNGLPMTFQITAVGGPLAWNAVMMLIDSVPNSLLLRTAASNVLVAENAINYTPSTAFSSFNNGDPVVVTVSDGGTMPGGLTKGTRYYIGSLSQTQVRLYTDEARQNPVDITSTGSGAVLIRSVIGSLHSVHFEEPTVVLATGTSKTYRIGPYLNG